jgi:hypothetical protein
LRFLAGRHRAHYRSDFFADNRILSSSQITSADTGAANFTFAFYFRFFFLDFRISEKREIAALFEIFAFDIHS